MRLVTADGSTITARRVSPERWDVLLRNAGGDAVATVEMTDDDLNKLFGGHHNG